MINGIGKILTSNSLNNITSNTNSQVMLETTLKAIGRPGFILIDNEINEDTKRYAAAKEFLYQATCLLVYAALVVPVFKRGAFTLAQKVFDKSEIGSFKSLKQYAHYLKLCDTTPTNRIQTLGKEIKGTSIVDADGKVRRQLVKDEYDAVMLKELQKTDENDPPNTFHKLKGAIEFGNIVGSVFGLAIFAPQISHAFIHPALKFLGLEKEAEKSEKNKNIDKTV